jgi:hypothetical protein
MRENELADLLIRMAADRGIEVEPAAEELASIALPSFVDSRAFRSAVIHALEAHLHAQVEERLQSIRRRFDMEPPRQAVMPTRPGVSPPASVPVADSLRSPSKMDGMPDLADATMTDLAPLSPAAATENAAAVEEELPTDATMVWTTRHG